MAWFYLFLAGMLEIVGVTGINKIIKKKSVANFSLLIGGFALSFLFLSLAMEEIPMSTAYAIWTGTGTAGAAIVGILFFKEAKDGRRSLCILMIIAAAVGLQLMS